MRRTRRLLALISISNFVAGVAFIFKTISEDVLPKIVTIENLTIVGCYSFIGAFPIALGIISLIEYVDAK